MAGCGMLSICKSAMTKAEVSSSVPEQLLCVGFASYRKEACAHQTGLRLLIVLAVTRNANVSTAVPLGMLASPPVCVGSGDVCGRLAAIHSLIQQMATEVSAVDPLIMPSITDDQASVIAHEWSSVKSSVSTLSAAVATITHHISAAPPPPPCQPDTAVDVTANRLPSDVFCDGVVGYLPVDVAISPARATNTHYGTQLINEAFMLKRVDCSLDSNHLSGLIDVYRPTFQYFSKCAYVLEQGGHVWREMAEFIRVAAIYKLIKALPLPLMLSPQWMADHLATKAAFDELPLALAIYNTFGHLLHHQGTTLELRRVEGDDGDQDSDSDGDDEDMEGASSDEDEDRGQQGDGGGGVTRQRYRIGDVEFTTLPLTDLPPAYPYRSAYSAVDPPIRRRDFFFPSFTAFIERMVLMYWCRQEGVEQKRVTGARVGLDDTRYLSLLTEPIEGYKTVDYMGEPPGQGDDGRERLIIFKGTAATDTIEAWMRIGSGNIHLYTTEAPIKGNTDIERFPAAVAAARPLLATHELEQAVLGLPRSLGAGGSV
ncbi:unnamed protein product [Vitrella brassicaformis CCMP3155]|uniref:Uncharacterized protein n=1 Tax=Vitrella brassicaformis (strain CCMP3155) TaxID=1169540 RepID=A0A0G4G4A7_VITBC|nr:unnamed protein product [Vitrella brassicaformis CCMP3155]|eukprot:CEM22743.1 unnamed protein product [Vitrella brassicaformis CCMP3155]